MFLIKKIRRPKAIKIIIFSNITNNLCSLNYYANTLVIKNQRLLIFNYNLINKTTNFKPPI